MFYMINIKYRKKYNVISLQKTYKSMLLKGYKEYANKTKAVNLHNVLDVD